MSAVRESPTHGRPVALVVLSASIAAVGACRPTAEENTRLMQVAQAQSVPQQTYPSVSVGLNQHLRSVVRRSTYAVDLSGVVDNSPKIITEPVVVTFHDPTRPRLDFELPPARFLSIDQTGGWVYGFTATPQLRASTVDDAFAIASAVERRLSTTAWQRDPAWSADEARARAWAMSDRASLPFARFTSGSAQVRIALKRTGAPTSSERLRGRTGEGFYVDVDVTDLSRLNAYEELVDQRRRAMNGDVTQPLPVGAFLGDTTPP